MKIENHPNYVVLEDEKDDIIDFASFIESQVPSKYKVNDAIEVDEVPFEMIVVPTIQEAGDIVEMEEIERDLGF